MAAVFVAEMGFRVSKLAGLAVTAEDAKWSFERYISVKPGDTYQQTVANQVESVTATDARGAASSP